MNHLVFLDAQAGDLEKILSGIKTMIIKEFDPAQSPVQPVMPGDSLFFLRNNGECAVRVTARVVHIFPFWESVDDDLTQILKEMQPRLQLTEDQYQHWSAKEVLLFVEFDSARKIPVIAVAVNRVNDRSGWMAFEAFRLIT
jgi:hypothetical protein